MPLSPATAARHVDGASAPIGVTAPSPVTTTRLIPPTSFSEVRRALTAGVARRYAVSATIASTSTA